METPTTTTTSSPEFEFWQVRNPSSQQPTLHSADQLFSDGVLLPLRLLTTDDPPDIINHINITTTSPEVNINLNLNPPSLTQHPHQKTTFTTSKRWKDIFKKNPETKDSEKKKKKNSGGGSAAAGGGGVAGTAELNINLWPFSRSRSAGTTGSRQRTVAGGNRKVSSAPCSRSNSTGDKYRKWPTSPARPGVHLGRSSPVWQAKRVGQTRKNVNLNVPTCIGYRQRMSCNAGGKGGVRTVNGGGDGGATTGLFNLRSLFTKKVF
ncbi:uncharacterized protein LOC143529699 [Bidens hawaiensis]|uniref:uncharacterized protein LOC143529699 n=1 Tax=Bidens hawaiensis TaxID=980011 RepID=UPI00404B8333